MLYALDEVKAQISEILGPNAGRLSMSIRTPPPNIDGDLSVPIFSLAKKEGTRPEHFASKLAARIDLTGTFFCEVRPHGGFLNFRLDPKVFLPRVFQDFSSQEIAYGGSRQGSGKTIVVDYSSPNIAKPFSIGHLRSTVIGQALCNILRFLGYRVIGDNHLGDWGTQFGKLLYAYSAWGSREEVEAHPIATLHRLYVRFHSEAETNGDLEAAAREWFKKLEEGDPEAVELWRRFKELSLLEFRRIYDLLEVEFDETLGESFYNDMLDETVQEAFAAGITRWSTAAGGDPASAAQPGAHDLPPVEGEQLAIIDLEAHGIKTPLIIQKSDGTSLYATRDLATAKYRIRRWSPQRILYVVGSEQRLYFSQWFKALELMGYETHCEHVPFGLIRLPEGKLSTRKGRVILLEEVLDEAIQRAEDLLRGRGYDEQQRKEIARKVGIGAVKFADLGQDRTKDVVFSWDKMLSMQGDSAPYLQYAYVRIQSILSKAPTAALVSEEVEPALLASPEAIGLVKVLAKFPETVSAAGESYRPHILAAYLLDLAKSFTAFYGNVPVLQAESPRLVAMRLRLCRMTAEVLKQGLALLGISCPEKM